MKCPNCNEELIYEDELDSGYYGEEHYCVTWLMACPKCDFEQKLYETYVIENREWDNESK